MNRWVRAGSFAAALLMIASHLQGDTHHWLIWALLVTHLLLYPHALYAFSLRSTDPMRNEIRALQWDPVFTGGWLAWLGFPLWISFVMTTGALVSITTYRGPRGALLTFLSMVLGAGAVAAMQGGMRFNPDTGALTTALGMVSLGIYMLMVADGARQRGLKLRAAREALRQKERALQRQLDDNHILQQQLQEQANRDPLTGLFNRRYLDATMARELTRCQRESQPLSLLVMDIDHFKRINDEHGHPAGDEVLRQVAQLLARRARSSDVVCRYGGEEYVALLPNMTAHKALVRAEEYRSLLQAMPIAFEGKELHVTLSIGIASFPKHGSTVHDLIHVADAALYQAKQAGRNRVVEAPSNDE